MTRRGVSSIGCRAPTPTPISCSPVCWAECLKDWRAQWLPPPPVEGNAYNVPLPQLSDDMDDAIEDFERSDFIRRLFGPELRRIFAEIKREELKAFDNEITPLERSTYL
jgi:glutamine synthetase